MASFELLDPGWAWDKNFPLAQGLRIGDVVILSGQVAFNAEGKVVGDDIRTQTRQVFMNIKEILNRAGATFQDVVKLTTFFTIDITDKSAVQGYFEVRREFFGDHRPASTGVQITSLVVPQLLLEVEATAYIPDRR